MKTLFILVLTIISLNLFAKENEYKYVMVEADKNFEIFKYFTSYVIVDEIENKRGLVGEVKEEYAKNLDHYYKAVYNDKLRLVRLEEYRKKKLYGFYIYIYDRYGFEAGLQYHYLGNLKVTDEKQKLFHIKVIMDKEGTDYSIEYYNKDKLVKREIYSGSGDLLKTETVNK